MRVRDCVWADFFKIMFSESVDHRWCRSPCEVGKIMESAGIFFSDSIQLRSFSEIET